MIDETRPDAPLTRSERLDRLPFTRKHGKLLVGSGVGWALDAMDVGLIAFVVAALGEHWLLTDTERSWIVSVGFVGMAVGASLGGLLADRIGRRQVFALTLLVYGLATGVSALAWSVGILMALRFVVGLGLGAELPVASTLVSEFAPARIRGRVVVVLEAFWAVGWTLAALIGYLVIPTGEAGWRWALVIGGVPALYAVVVRRGLPESVRFLQRQGREDEAEAVVRGFEESAGIAPPAERDVPDAAAEDDAATRTEDVPPRAEPTGADVVPEQIRAVDPSAAADLTPPRAAPPPPAPSPGPGALWAPGMRRRTAAAWVVWFFVNFSYYGAFTWIPSLLIAGGFTLVRSFEYTLLITLAQLPGYAVAAVLIEVWGRRATLSTFLIGSAVAAVLFGNAEGTGAILATGMLLSFFNLGAWGALYAVTPEIYPTPLRGTGAGWAAGFGRIASIVAPLAVPPLLVLGGVGGTFAVFATAFVIAAVAALALPELRGRALAD